MGGDNIYENDKNNEIAKLLVEDKVDQECLAKDENKIAIRTRITWTTGRARKEEEDADDDTRRYRVAVSIDSSAGS